MHALACITRLKQVWPQLYNNLNQHVSSVDLVCFEDFGSHYALERCVKHMCGRSIMLNQTCVSNSMFVVTDCRILKICHYALVLTLCHLVCSNKIILEHKDLLKTIVDGLVILQFVWCVLKYMYP